MVSEAVEEMVEQLPELQSTRGDDFREMSDSEQQTIARQLVIARSQANASNADWDDKRFFSEMVDKRMRYTYYCGKYGVDLQEARIIWWKAVHDNPSPHERKCYY